RRLPTGIPILLFALPLAIVPRRLARTFTVAAGNARRDHHRDVVELGRDKSQDGGAIANPAGRACRSQFAAWKRPRASHALAGNRAGCDSHADWTGARKI